MVNVFRNYRRNQTLRFTSSQTEEMPDQIPQQKVDAKSVMELRRQTGFGVLQCKLLLAEAGSVDNAIALIKSKHPMPVFESYSGLCPNCGGGLRGANQMDCPNCDWLRVPATDRTRWGHVGRCPKCGFSYRWDGVVCSHCGNMADV